MATPAQQAGIVKGKKYLVHSPLYDYTHGKIVVLDDDDDSYLPYFKTVKEDGTLERGHVCVYLPGYHGNTFTEVVDTEETALTYNIDVSATGTVIKTSSKLTLDQIKAIMEIIGG